METSLHRELKQIYAHSDHELEAPLDGYRIDVLRGSLLIEIQHGSLAAIRDKIRDLIQQYRVLVVKPIILRKRLVKLDGRNGRIVGRRLSPKRGRDIDLFHELIYFTEIFPHTNLSLEVPLIEIEERRFPGHGRRRRRRDTDHVIEDQRLLSVDRTLVLHGPADLLQFVPADLEAPFDTQQLADGLDTPRWVAQRITYCLARMGALTRAGKRGNAVLYAKVARLTSAPTDPCPTPSRPGV